MIPVDQTKFAPAKYDGKNYGNCIAACLASIMEVPIEEVPHFPYMMNEQRLQWMESKGWTMSQTPGPHGAWKILVGVSPRTQIQADGETVINLNHAVVGQVMGHEDKIVFDPHPSRAGILSIDQKYWVADLFIRFNTSDSYLDSIVMAKNVYPDRPVVYWNGKAQITEIYFLPNGKVIRIEHDGEIKEGWYLKGNETEVEATMGPICHLRSSDCFVATCYSPMKHKDIL